jgi:hypothetical protein
MSQVNTWPHMDGDENMLVQHLQCFGDLTVAICELRGLVSISEMPEESRQRLIDGLAHIEGHIYMQLRQLIEDAQQRKN